MVVDYKLFKAGQPLSPGLLWVLEQVIFPPAFMDSRGGILWVLQQMMFHPAVKAWGGYDMKSDEGSN